MNILRQWLCALWFLGLVCFNSGCEFQFQTPLKFARAESNAGTLKRKANTIQDDWVEMTVGGDTREISFTLKNLSQSDSVKIIWDDCVFIRANGDVDRIIHGGVKLRSAGESMPPTNVPRGAKVQDVVMPASNVSMGDKGWNRAPLVRMTEKKQQVGVLLVIRRGDESREYTLTFDVPTI